MYIDIAIFNHAAAIQQSEKWQTYHLLFPNLYARRGRGRLGMFMKQDNKELPFYVVLKD